MKVNKRIYTLAPIGCLYDLASATSTNSRNVQKIKEILDGGAVQRNRGPRTKVSSQNTTSKK